MIEDVYEPLAKYRDEFKARFSELARAKFMELAKASGVDVAANRRLVSEVKRLEGEADAQSGKKSLVGFLMAAGFIGAACSLGGVILTGETAPENRLWWILGIIAGVALGLAMMPLYGKASRLLEKLKGEVCAKRAEAWRQMEPLNSLYTWDLTVKLIESTVPRLKYDPYFTAERLESLRSQFGWDDGFNDGKSIIFAQSGVINGNPFVFGQYLDMDWGEKTYEGTKHISWSEWETGSDGKRRRVVRHETLHAYVTKPIPVYSEQKLLVYGNDAAPDLSFSRVPSGLSGDDSAFFSNLKKKWRLGRLKAYSRDLTDDSDFTLMGNHEFETWFHAKDRDNEVEFRLLFTPVAQTQMLKLMKDDAVGYGDDFSFVKARRINVLASHHLNEGVIDTDPAHFRHWDFDAAFANFMTFNERYFKDAYFSLAPLLAIPLYQQTRTHEEIWKGIIAGRPSSFWEHEAIANYHGENLFRHPESATRNILKTSVTSSGDGESEIAVTAYGFKGVKRVDYEDVYGGDGRWHSVPVPWVEYLPVEKTSRMCITERTSPSDPFVEEAGSSRAAAFRRSIYSFVG